VSVDLTNQILAAAVNHSRNHGLRAYDAVQLASVIGVRTALFTAQPDAGVGCATDGDSTDVNDFELAFVEEARFVWRFEAF
jgi:hypothetical protein